MKTARTHKQLRELRYKNLEVLTIEDLLKSFTKEQIEASTYKNKIGEYIRLFNTHEERSQVPSLYSYDVTYIRHFQQHYSNISPLNIEVTGINNRKLDVILRGPYKAGDTRENPPLPGININLI